MLPDAELNRLRSSLYGYGWEAQEIDQIIDQASSDVNLLILDVVENAVADAVDYAQQLGAEDFIDQIDIQESGGYYRVWTINGVTDFSTPEREMLPDLLKNAPENPNTGNKNKVIPVGSKKITQFGDIFSVMQDRQRQLDEARASLLQSNKDNRSVRANQVATQFRSILHRNLKAKKAERQINEQSGERKFRTASSKQDPSESWVYPAKDMNMLPYLMDLNARIVNTLDYAITELINSYIIEYQ